MAPQDRLAQQLRSICAHRLAKKADLGFFPGLAVHGGLRFLDRLRVDGVPFGSVVGWAASSFLPVVSKKSRATGKVKAWHVIIRAKFSAHVRKQRSPYHAVEGSRRL